MWVRKVGTITFNNITPEETTTLDQRTGEVHCDASVNGEYFHTVLKNGWPDYFAFIKDCEAKAKDLIEEEIIRRVTEIVAQEKAELQRKELETSDEPNQNNKRGAL
jgi:hypothetical protein